MTRTPERLGLRRMLGLVEVLALLFAVGCQAEGRETSTQREQTFLVSRDEKGLVLDIMAAPGVIENCETSGNQLADICQRTASIFGVPLAAIPPYAVIDNTHYGNACSQLEDEYSKACYLSPDDMAEAVKPKFPKGLVIVGRNSKESLLHEAGHAWMENKQGANINDDGTCSGFNEGGLGRLSANQLSLEVNLGTEETFIRIMSFYAWTQDYANKLLLELPPETDREQKIQHLTANILNFEFTLLPDGVTYGHEPWQQLILNQFAGLRDRFGEDNANRLLRAVMAQQVDGESLLSRPGLFSPDNSGQVKVDMTILAQKVRSLLLDGQYEVANLSDNEVLIFFARTLNPKGYSKGLQTSTNPAEFYKFVPACPVTIPSETVTITP